ncbi:protein E47A (6A) [Elephant endotheliotropic herpesvirus 5B]|nr:protein E47A (6A) [Elephant endotheliotropic herpesvirus 5B]
MNEYGGGGTSAPVITSTRPPTIKGHPNHDVYINGQSTSIVTLLRHSILPHSMSTSVHKHEQASSRLQWCRAHHKLDTINPENPGVSHQSSLPI